jgi:hypothetical protein
MLKALSLFEPTDWTPFQNSLFQVPYVKHSALVKKNSVQISEEFVTVRGSNSGVLHSVLLVFWTWSMED